MSFPLNSWLRRLACVFALALPALATAQSADKPFTNEQLDQLTAQVALYPDSLLAQVLMASTYPADFAAAATWSKAHPDAKGDDAVRMVENEPWDPSVASLVAFPEVLITLGEKPAYVKDLGDAFLAQPEDVMNSVQRLRQKAQQAGNLKTNEQIKVTTEAAPPPSPQVTVVQQSAPPPQVIVIEPAQPSVVYVPAYNPAFVYGPWPYPAYPPYYYPPPPGYWFSRTIATGIAWGIGIGVSNALWGGCNWGRGDVNINVNRYNNINSNRQWNSNNNNWSHNVDNRKNVAYRGGDGQRQNLQNKAAATDRQQYRGKDASRDASRERASQTMQSRGVDVAGGSARERAQSVDRSAAQQRAQGVDRGSMQGGAQPRNDAFQGVGNRQAGQEVNRGNASRQSAQSYRAPSPAERTGGGSRSQMSGGGAGGARASGGGGGGGARASGGGGGGRGGGGGGRR